MPGDSAFLRSLLGQRVRIIAVDEDALPTLTLREISLLGVVAEDSAGARFFPWAEIVEISSARPGRIEWELSAVACGDAPH